MHGSEDVGFRPACRWTHYPSNAIVSLWGVGVWEYRSAGFSMQPAISQYSITPICSTLGPTRGRVTKPMRLFGNPLDSLTHPSLRSLDRRALPFEGLQDFAGQGRFAGRHIVNELFFSGDLHARVVLLLVAERRDRLPIVVTGKDANLISEGFEFPQTVILPLGVPTRQI